MHKYGADGVPIWTRKMYMPTSNWSHPSHFPDLSCATPFCFYTCKLHPLSINFSRVIKLSAPQGSTGILKTYFSDTLIKLAYRLVKCINLKGVYVCWIIIWSLRISIKFRKWKKWTMQCYTILSSYSILEIPWHKSPLLQHLSAVSNS